MRSIDLGWRRLTRWTVWLMVAWVCVAVTLALGAIWQQVQTSSFDLQALWLLPILGLTATSFALRCLRWHILVRRVVPAISIKQSIRHFFIGFGLTVTPGKAGEIYKLYCLQKDTGVPIARSLPALAVEKMSEAVAFGVLAIGAALALPDLRRYAVAYRWPLIGMAVLSVVVIIAGPVLAYMLKKGMLQKRSWWRRGGQQFASGGTLVLGVRPLLAGTGLGLLGRSLDGLALLSLAHALGVFLPTAGGLFILGTSGLTGGFSMLPGGLGAVEMNQAGLLMLWGAGWSAALLITLLLRLGTLWLWIGLGLGVLVWSERRTVREGKVA